MRMSVIYFFATIFILVAPRNAVAVEVLSAEELASHCVAFPQAADSLDGEYCVRYIQGFIDGAVTTDVWVMRNIEADTDTAGIMDKITERAMRTRLPSRSESRRAASYAEFCLGDPIPLKEVVEFVVKDLNSGLEAAKSLGSARDVVYESLRKNYPCEKE